MAKEDGKISNKKEFDIILPVKEVSGLMLRESVASGRYGDTEVEIALSIPHKTILIKVADKFYEITLLEISNTICDEVIK